MATLMRVYAPRDGVYFVNGQLVKAKAGDVLFDGDGCLGLFSVSEADIPMPQEICICAAIRLTDGRIIRGHRHDDCLHTLKKWRDVGQKVEMETQGFVTSANRFVDRTEGARLMREAKHISAYSGQLFKSDYLFSEDLY